jgi:hypothetical protein
MLSKVMIFDGYVSGPWTHSWGGDEVNASFVVFKYRGMSDCLLLSSLA